MLCVFVYVYVNLVAMLYEILPCVDDDDTMTAFLINPSTIQTIMPVKRKPYDFLFGAMLPCIAIVIPIPISYQSFHKSFICFKMMKINME